MKMTKIKWVNGLFLICAFLAFSACEDDAEPAGSGEAEFEITDAPVDDANINGVFVTVADIKVNGNSLEGFSKQTIDLKAYTEGKTKLLGSGEFDARTYENITLVLDLETDADGNSPGCYVLDANETKHRLKSTTTGTTDVVINKSWNVAKDTKSTFVIDFDLRKAIRYSAEGDSDYRFASDDNLKAAINVVAKAKTGVIQGTYEESNDSNADKIIVYAYKKGTFDATTETKPQGDDAIMFANARSSAEVKSSLTGNDFKLAFLEEGEYELYFVAYTQEVGTGRLKYESRLESETEVNGSVGNVITVSSGVTIDVSATITGIL